MSNHTQYKALLAEYNSLRDDYKLLKENMKANVDRKKEMRKELDRLRKAYQLDKLNDKKSKLEA